MSTLGLPRSVLGLIVVSLVSAAAPAAAATDTTPVSLSFTGPKSGAAITSAANDGSGATSQSVVTANGGRLRARWSRISTGIAARYPAYDGAGNGRRAILAVTNSGSSDDLGPGAQEFVFGADAKLNAVSTGSANDNGNNLVQRGLATATAQYKLQLDGGRFSCRVKGDDGAQFVRSSLKTSASTWYHALCKRRVVAAGDFLVIKVAKVRADGSRGSVRKNVSTTGSIGNLSFTADTPLSVGGKLIDATTISSASDQWNGVVDSVFLTIRS